MELKDLKRYELDNTPSNYGLQPYIKGNWVLFEDVKQLLKNDIPLVELTPTLKNDSKRHNMVFKGTNITYRLSVKKSHFWIYNRDTGQEIQYINSANGIPEPYKIWDEFMESCWDEILEDMK